MNRQSKLKALERALVRRLRAAGHEVERPACYREAQYDADGHLLPVTPNELREIAASRATYREEGDRSFIESYQRPTLAWPEGKSNLIDDRVARATGSSREARDRLLEQLRAFKLETKRVTELPMELRVSLFIAGLMDKPPSEVTRSALAVFHPLGLFVLLSIDPPVVERRRHRARPRIEERQLREYVALLPVLREFGGRIIDAHVLDTVLTKLQQILEARVISPLSQAEHERRHTRRLRDMIAVRDTGWSTSAVGYRRSKLTKLVCGLRAAEPDRWPVSRIAALLMASERDWALSPCPNFLKKYRGRLEALEDLLKKDLVRANASQPTTKQALE